MSDNIKVVVKVRPLICREIEEKLFHQWRVKNNTLYQIDLSGKDCGNLFTFDKVYDETTNTTDVYDDIAKPIVEAAAAGFNGTIFAYGQTSSGKTYTMTGTEESLGIIPLSVINLFDIIKNKPDRDFLVRVSYVEIYNDTLIDLLNIDRKNIKIQDTLQGVKVDATVRVTTSPEEVFQFMKEGLANRQTGSTNMNEESSRSHSIFQITIESREQNTEGEEVGCLNISQLNLVDLAGSERSGQTGATGIRFKEGTHINKSLSSLALVIKQLSSEGLNKHVNYRDSKLTRILQNSLGGNAKTAIICAVTPAALEETISTLQFAYRAKAIKNNPEVNVVATDSKIIDSLTKQLSSLKTQLENKRNVEEDNQKLQKQISALQRFLSGFGQHSRVEVMTGARRKLQQLRRATISTAELRQEEEMTNAPRFRTPTLKYNALSLARSSEVTMESMGGLAIVPEEPVRVVTPPPEHHRVTFNEEIIVLDSDEDMSLNVQTCSPYHKCIRECKTPPCILKKVARDAEKNLNEIIELTQLEKMYTPNVVELMEKLERSDSVISKLEEEIDSLNKYKEETQTKMEALIEKISKNEEEVRNLVSAKLQLEMLCKDNDTKLTDWEVTYDTLKKKAKTREKELLSRLEELSNIKKSIDNSKLAAETRIETSNLSIAKSDSILSTLSTNDSTCQNIQDLVLDLKEQINVRDKTILELEANIEAQNQKIYALEHKTKEIEKVSDLYKEKLLNSEQENILHKSTIDTLNSMIAKQKHNLDSATIDMQSYSDTIEELQKMITKKESVLKCNDAEIENLIFNEERMIANNENIRNIIQSLKITLDKKNSEIEILKSTIQKNDTDCDNAASSNELKSNKTQITELHKKVTTLTKQLQDIQLEKEDLLLEKMSLLNSLEELNNEFSDCTKRNTELDKNIKNCETEITNLKEINQGLHNSLNGMKSLENKLALNDMEFKNMHTEMSAKYSELIANNKALTAKNTEVIEHNNELSAKNTEVIARNNELSEKNTEVIAHNTELSSKNTEMSVIITDLTAQNLGLIANNTEFTAKNTELIAKQAALTERNAELSIKNEELTAKNIEVLNQVQENVIKINYLQQNLKLKDDKIKSIIENSEESANTYVNKAKEVTFKLHDILSVFTGENIDNLNLDGSSLLDVFKSLDEKIYDLRRNTTDIVSQRKHSKMQNDEFYSKIANAEKQLIAQINSIYLDVHELLGVIKETIPTKSLIGADKREDDIYEKCCTENTNNVLKVGQQVHKFTSFDDTITLLEEINVLMSDFKQKYEKIKLDSISKISELSHVIVTKDSEINRYSQQIHNLQAQLDISSQEIHSATEQCNIVKKESDEIFTNIINKILKLAQVMDLKDISAGLENVEKQTFITQQVIPMLDKLISEYLILLKKLEHNSIIKEQEVDNDVLIDLYELQSDTNFSKDLKISTKLLNDLKEELKVKTNEIDAMKKKVLEWKEKFKDFEIVMKKQRHDMQEENDKLKEKCLQYENEQKGTRNSTLNVEDVKDVFDKEALQVTEILNANLPQSLLTISCNKILEMMVQGSETDSQSVTSISSRSNIDQESSGYLVNSCECNILKEKLKSVQEQNCLLLNQYKDLQLTNKILMKEIHDATAELKTLLEFSNDLQKKIYNHKTNLSTLTAMTYAENKSLSSQVKFFQHRHTRFNTVCQRDLPELKNQLLELKTLLKEDNLECKINNVSLPNLSDNNSILNNFKNESTLDGDLLMLDTNVTLATSANNTLTSHNQTCFESTQICLYSDTECQTSLCYLNESSSPCDLCTYHAEKVKSLEIENENMKHLIQMKETKDFNISPFKENLEINNTKGNICSNCKNQEKHSQELIKELEVVNHKLADIVNKKEVIEKKYNNLSLEVPSTEALLRKLHNFERELQNKDKDIEKLLTALKTTKQEFKTVQEENDNLSTQVMESITEVDDLKLELETIKKCNLENDNKTKVDANVVKHVVCPECTNKDEMIKVLQNKYSNTHTRLNRSYSDSDSSSRYNKICTLQNELDAGREDCNELKEEVTTIKNHLESSNLPIDQAMELDKSICSSNDNNSQTDKSFMPKICEENASDIYILEKSDCINYYLEKVGDRKTNIHSDLKIIEVMKMLYSELMIKHDNQIENLVNKLRDYEESKTDLHEKIQSIIKQSEESNCNIQNVETKLLELKNNIDILKNAASVFSKEDSDKAINLFKIKILKVLDVEFSMNSLPLFETIYNSNVNIINETMANYEKLKEHSSELANELDTANNNLKQLEALLSTKEKECNMLLAQKAKIHEISDTVTMDLVKKEQDFSAAIAEGYQKLAEENILRIEDIDTTLPPIKNLHLLFKRLLDQNNVKSVLDKDKEIEFLKQDVINNKTLVEQKNKELDILLEQFESIKRLNADLSVQLNNKDDKLLEQKSLLEELNIIYNKKVEESNLNYSIIENITEEAGVLKGFILKKDTIIQNLEKKCNQMRDEINDHKRFNDSLCKEKELMANQLEKSREIIEQNKIDLNQMESNIGSLRESLKVKDGIIESLKNEAKLLSEHNSELKEQLDEKCKELVRLESNIKTHETTAVIQTKMISRLKKQNEEDRNVFGEKEKQLHNVNQKCTTLQNESLGLKDCITGLKCEIDTLIIVKRSLEDKISQMERQHGSNYRPRSSIESVMDTSRRRRQSIHDSKRIFGDKQPDHNKMDSMTEGRSKLDDSSMDVDESSSCRSTPVRHSKGRDSFHSKHEESEEEGRSSRCSNVLVSRQRRQSIHDMHRTTLQTSPEKHNMLRNRSADDSKIDTSSSDNVNSRVMELQDRLSSCQQELDELREKYRELDDECETCAEYLRERDEQCSRLKKDKNALDKKIIELNEKLQLSERNPEVGRCNVRIDCAHVAVNTDEDWANLHSVVVDRMSYDAEVEKNKKLTKAIEELRFQKQELKTVISKMQRSLEDNSTTDGRELESARKELRSCREELETLKNRNKELDEECETCSQYLRDRDEQCRRLKDTVIVLEAKVYELQENTNNITQSVRKKRQTIHDLHRIPAEERVDAYTQITEDFLSSQVERDNAQAVNDEVQRKQIKKLKLAVEKLSEQKTALEQQLMAAPTAPDYVATGSAIVQNQQITDVMKENRKLKKINAELVSLCKKRGKSYLNLT